MDNKNEVSHTILQQIGGGKFLVITGSKAILNGNKLHLQLVKNMSGANWLDITLDDNDTYTMRFYYFRKGGYRIDEGEFHIVPDKKKEIEILDGVYFDQLQDIFEQVTGLYTTLYPRT